MNKTKLAQRFQDLLLEYSQSEDLGKRREVEAALWQEYGAEYAVFVLDMSGFSMLTRKYGIVHYLSMVRRMQLTTEPIIRSFGGEMLKYEADNCFAIFPNALSAVNAAITMQHAFEAENLLTADELDIRIAVGIDYGRLLVIEHEDCFGDPVNRASKIGEDIASAGEILITRDALQAIPPEAGIKTRELSISISGISIPAYAVEYRENS